MTTTDKRVVRRGTRVASEAGHRRLVVAIEPGDILAFRPERSRRWERLPLVACYVMAVKARVDAERREKRASACSIFKRKPIRG
jgi:hypothetical protein